MNPDPTDTAPVDLRLLDPSRDRARWDAMVARVVARAVAHTRRLTVGAQLAAWARPALALAAALALVTWVALALAPPAVPSGAVSELETLTDWAVDGAAPTATQIYELVEAHHGS